MVRRRSGLGEDDDVRADDALAAAGQRKNDPVMNFGRGDVETRAEQIFKRHHRQIASVIVTTAIAFRLADDARNLSRIDEALSHQSLEMADIRRPFGWDFECLNAHDCQSLWPEGGTTNILFLDVYSHLKIYEQGDASSLFDVDFVNIAVVHFSRLFHPG